MTVSADMIANEQFILADLPTNAVAKIEKRKTGVSDNGEHLEQWDTLAAAVSVHMGAKTASVQSIYAGQRQLTTWSATIAFIAGLDISCRFTISSVIYNVRSVRPSFSNIFQTVELVEVE